MGEVRHVVSKLVQMLDGGRKEAKSLVDTIDQLQSYLEEKPKSIIQEVGSGASISSTMDTDHIPP